MLVAAVPQRLLQSVWHSSNLASKGPSSTEDVELSRAVLFVTRSGASFGGRSNLLHRGLCLALLAQSATSRAFAWPVVTDLRSDTLPGHAVGWLMFWVPGRTCPTELAAAWHTLQRVSFSFQLLLQSVAVASVH